MADDALTALRREVGRTDRSEDTLTSELVRRFRAMFDEDPGAPADGELAPAGIHWCLSPPVAPASWLGPDGHPARGGLMPPASLPRRMWAGGELAFLGPLRVGERVERTSRLAAVEAKAGRTGPLCFVTIEHALRTGRGPAIRERQDIVYRGPSTGAVPRAGVEDPAASPWQAQVRAFHTDPTLLFRYSSLTFNGHRIHYDRDYARNVEGYDDLVVHGPLQATVLLRFAANLLGAVPSRFSFRGLSPLIVGRDSRLEAVSTTADVLALQVVDDAGAVTMTTTAHR